MKQALIFALVFALCMPTGEGEVILIQPAYWACVVTICGYSGPVPIGGWAVCGSALLICACFDESTVLTTRDGKQLITSVQAGEEVFTLDPITGNSMWTKVQKNSQVEGNFTLKAITVQNNTLRVTENHMFIKLHEGNYSIVMAAQVNVGDVVRHAGGTGQVEKISTIHAPRKVDFMTEACSVLADNVLTTTSCENKEQQEEILKHDASGDFESLRTKFANLVTV